MGEPLSIDLRSRLIAAVAGGMSRRATAERFGVAAASAVRWVHACNTTGAIGAKPQGGDMRSHHIEAFRDGILTAIEVQRDITRVQAVRDAAHSAWRVLRGQHGLAFPQPSRADFQKCNATIRHLAMAVVGAFVSGAIGPKNTPFSLMEPAWRATLSMNDGVARPRRRYLSA